MPLSSLPSQHLLALINDTAVVTWSLGPDGYVIDVPHWCELTGQTPEEVEGAGWLNAVHPADRSRVEAAWSTALAHGQHFNTDYRIRCADGIYRWFNARGTPIRAESGEVERWVGVCLEIPGLWRFGNAFPSTIQDMPGEALSPPLIRAARAMMNVSAAELAKLSGVSLSTVRRLETDENDVQARRSSTDRLAQTFAASGIRFIQGDDGSSGVTIKAGAALESSWSARRSGP